MNRFAHAIKAAATPVLTGTVTELRTLWSTIADALPPWQTAACAAWDQLGVDLETVDAPGTPVALHLSTAEADAVRIAARILAASTAPADQTLARRLLAQMGEG